MFLSLFPKNSSNKKPFVHATEGECEWPGVCPADDCPPGPGPTPAPRASDAGHLWKLLAAAMPGNCFDGGQI